MKLSFCVFLIVFYLFVSACSNPQSHSGISQAKKAPATKVDTTKSFKIANTWVTPKSSLDFNALNKFAGDTLDLVVCGKYVYEPFGGIKSKKDFKSSLLSNFSVTNRMEREDSGTFEFNSLRHNKSKLLFFFDTDPEASAHSSVFKGEIYDADVHFVNGIKIGMPTANFYNTLFDYFPVELISNYHVVVLESCVQDIIHTYIFKNGKLASVKFTNDSYWKVDY